MSLYIYHHLGLGDHIICNAIVRHYAKINDEIFLFVKPHNYENVKYMYRDLNNIMYIQGEDSYVNEYLKTNNITNVLKIGFEKLVIQNNIFDKSFYDQINMPFEKRWIDFYFQRDLKREIEVFKTFQVQEGEYAFIQEDRKRNFCIDKSKVNPTLKIISSDNEFKFFELCYLIENADEIHITESSFRPLIDHLNVKTTKLFVHQKARHIFLTITTKKKWEFI